MLASSPELLRLFELLGWLLARALIDGMHLDVHFNQAFYKSLLHLPVCFDDLESVDKALYDSLKDTMQMAPEEVEFLCYTFEVPDNSSLDEAAVHELKPGGADIEVTADNREEFVQLWAEWVLEGCVWQQREAVRRGFAATLPVRRPLRPFWRPWFD
jgi:hypothetical protein